MTQGWNPSLLHCRQILYQRAIVALFVTAKNVNNVNGHPQGRWINKMWCFHTMKYCSVVKRQDLLIHATTWMNLKKNFMLRNLKRQQQKGCSLIKKKNSREDKSNLE